MAVKLADAIVAMAADVDQLRADLNKAQTATAQTTGDMETRSRGMGDVMKGVFQGIGQSIAGFAVQAVGQAVGYMNDAIDAASDLGETTSKIGVIFGDSAGGIMEWAEAADTALGQSKQQALDAAAQFATFGKQAGLSGQDLNKFSTDFVGLASDLASFNNTTPEQAINAIGAALRGESEPLRSYGVLLDAASVKAKAMSMGLVQGEVDALKLSKAQEQAEKAQRKLNEATQKYGPESQQATDAARDLEQAQEALAEVVEGKIPDLTKEQQLLATQALIYEQTAAAQGDFARTSQGAANQQRILDAQMANLKSTVGEALLPVWVMLIQTLNQLVQIVLPPVAEFIQNVLTPAITAVVDVVGNYIGAIMDAGASSSEAQQALGLFPAVLQPVIAFITNLVSGLQSLVSGIISFVSTASQWFGTFRTSVEDDGLGPMSYLQEWFNENMPRIQQIVETVLGALQRFWTEHGDAIMHVVENYLQYIYTIFDTVLKTILDLVTLFLQLLTGDWEGAGETLIGIVQRLWDAIYEIVRLALDSIKAIFTDFDWGSIGSNMMGGIRDGINSGAGWVTSSVQNAVSNAYNTATSWLGIQSPSRRAATGIGQPFAEGIALGIRNRLRDVSVNVSAGLKTMMDGVSMPVPAMGPALAPQGPSFSITLNITGATDPHEVGRQARDGVLRAARSLGVR